jgi:general secretion pathway protein B
MSLILDALKKSEAERQRQSGPTLLEVRVTQPRRRYPTWVIAVAVLLAVNMLLLLAFVLRRPATPGAPAAAAAAPASSVPAAASAPMASALPSSVAPVAVATPAAAAIGAPDAGVLVTPPRISPEPDLAADGPNGSGNPADDEPAVPASAAASYSSLPSFNDVGGDMPELRLDLHVYAVHARERYALINMHRVHEGDTLAEGPRVLAITREGVALDYRGQQFMLRPQ